MSQAVCSWHAERLGHIDTRMTLDTYGLFLQHAQCGLAERADAVFD